MTPAELMRVKHPGTLFNIDAAQIEIEFRRLRSIMHPDKGGTAEASARLKELYELAQAQSMSGVLVGDRVVQIRSTDNRVFSAVFDYQGVHDLGAYYVGGNFVTYVLDKSWSDLAEQSRRFMGGLKYSNAELEKYVKPCMPRLAQVIETSAHIVHVFHKHPSQLVLRDLLERLDGKLPPVHAAWLTSRLLNLVTYMSRVNLVHYDISLDTVFVDAATHEASLYGGWWFAQRTGDRLLALPARTLALDVVKLGAVRTLAEPRHATALARATVLETLGDAYGSKLLVDKTIPKQMLASLRSLGNEDPYIDFKNWMEKVLPAAYGKRSFVKLEVPNPPAKA